MLLSFHALISLVYILLLSVSIAPCRLRVAALLIKRAKLESVNQHTFYDDPILNSSMGCIPIGDDARLLDIYSIILCIVILLLILSPILLIIFTLI